MSENSIKLIIDRLDALDKKMDDHIVKCDSLYDDINTARKVGGWVNRFFNSKLGWATLLALAGYWGIKQ